MEIQYAAWDTSPDKARDKAYLDLLNIIVRTAKIDYRELSDGQFLCKLTIDPDVLASEAVFIQHCRSADSTFPEPTKYLVFRLTSD